MVKPPSPTRDTTKRDMLGVRHQIAVILDTAHDVLDIYIYVLTDYTDSELHNLFILQRFFYLWEGLLNRKTFILVGCQI